MMYGIKGFWVTSLSRLHRDPSIISRLYMTYAANRDRSKETFLAKQLRQ